MGRLDGLPPDIILAIFDNLFYLRDIPSLARASSSVYGVFSCYKAFILDHGLQRNLNAESIPYVARIFVFSSSIDPDNPCEKKKKIRLHLTRPLEQFKSPDFGNLKTTSERIQKADILLSDTERRRLQRAFLSLHYYGRVFSGLDDNAFVYNMIYLITQQNIHGIQCLNFWELEEAVCACWYLSSRVKSLFDGVEANFVQAVQETAERDTSEAKDRLCCGDKFMDNGLAHFSDSFRINTAGHRDLVIGLGLPFLHRLFPKTDYEIQSLMHYFADGSRPVPLYLVIVTLSLRAATPPLPLGMLSGDTFQDSCTLPNAGWLRLGGRLRDELEASIDAPETGYAIWDYGRLKDLECSVSEQFHPLRESGSVQERIEDVEMTEASWLSFCSRDSNLDLGQFGLE